MYTLYNEDCFKIMEDMIKNNQKVDCIITDPPYEMDIHGGTRNNDFGNRKLVKDKHIDFICDGFDYEKCFSMFLKICDIPNFLIFCSNNQVSKTMTFFENIGLSVTLLVWSKLNPIPFCFNKYVSDLEFIVYVHGKGACFNNNEDYAIKLKTKRHTSPSSKDRIHPTQKPLSLLFDLVKLHTKENDTIFDPFMGSGSTGIACLTHNRNFIGCEINEEFFKKTSNQFEGMSIQQELF